MKKVWKPLAYLLASILAAGSLQLPVPAAEAETILIEAEADNADQGTDNVDQAADNADQVEDIFFEPEAEENTEEEEIPASVTYTVTLDANGGVFPDQWDDSLGRIAERAEVLTKAVPEGESVEVFPPVRESVDKGQSVPVFTGWSFSREGEAVIPAGEAFVPDADCCLYAVWQTREAVDSAMTETVDGLPDSDQTGETTEKYEATEARADAAASEDAEVPAETADSETLEFPAGTEETEEAGNPAEEVVPGPEESVDSSVVEETENLAEVPDPEAGKADQEAEADPAETSEIGDAAESGADRAVLSEEGPAELVSSPASMESETEGENIPRAESISFTQTEIVGIAGELDYISLEWEPEDAELPQLLWSSSDESVADVNYVEGDSYAELCFLKQGTAVITASVADTPSIKASCKVTVTELVESMTLSRSSANLNKGKTFTLKVSKFIPASPSNKEVTWKSSNTKVATVDANGTVKGIAKGTATITATAKDGGGAKASCKVTVIVPVTKITLTKTSMTLNKGAKTALKVKSVTPSDANNKAVTWKSSNTKIATVDANGNVKAVAKGTATITATAKDGSGVKASCKVTVRVPVTKITLAKTKLTLDKGKKAVLKVKSVAPSNANNKAVTWKSSNKKIATVDAKGNVKAIAKGTATITATAKDGSGKKASCKVTVRIPVTKIKLNKTSASVKGGKKVTLKATVLPSNANNKAIKWSSSNPAVASVSSKGVVKGLSIGTATITGTAKDGSKKKVTAKVKVTTNAAVIASGKWNADDGPGGTWKIVPNKSNVPVKKCGCTLVFTGKGEMESSCKDDYSYPWSRYRSVVTDLRMGKGITKIALGAFSGFTKLKNVELPKGLKSIYDEAFSRCKALKEVSVPDSVTYMNNPFCDCTALTSFKIPAGVKRIDEFCFGGCKNLKSVTIHTGVKNIHYHAFEDCTSLKDVYYAGTAKQWKSIHIEEGNGLLKKAKIHYNSK